MAQRNPKSDSFEYNLLGKVIGGNSSNTDNIQNLAFQTIANVQIIFLIRVENRLVILYRKREL